MKIVVTGAAGFIGSHLCQRLIDRGDDVVGIDNFDPYYDTSFKRENVQIVKAADVFHSFEFFETDILDLTDEAMEAMSGADVICHLAAMVGVRSSITRPFTYQRVNVEGTTAMLQFARNVGIKRFVLASSSSVYGNDNCAARGLDRCTDAPLSPYAATKKSCELIGHVYNSLYDMEFRALRFFTVYGPRMRPDLAIGRFIAKTMRGEPITLFGDGTSSRDYSYIDDCVEGIDAAIYRHLEGPKFKVMDLGAGNPTSLNYLMRVIGHVVGKDPEIVHTGMQPGDPSHTHANSNQAHAYLDYKPKVTIEKGIERTVKWMKGVNKETQELYK